jgi:diguanylate cyclase (GGDEF)-like protein
MLFRETIEAALARVARGQRIAVHCLDLDYFKGVNDTLGHPIGDALLRTVTERLLGCVREHDTISRLGGDEFAIIQIAHSQADAAALARRIVETISQPYELDAHHVVIGASIGIAVAPDDGREPDELLKHADLALYRAKADGRGRYSFFEPGMDALMQVRRRLELGLRKALAEGEFELFYQPLINLETNDIGVFEALLRWHHPERGLVAPGEFIPVLEEMGLIVRVGEWILEQACRQAMAWPSSVKVAVNLSSLQFNSPNLVGAVARALTDAGLAASRLELEITESVLLRDDKGTLATLHRLKDLGVKIVMDDFGTGYSSLSYLRSFPFDKIKIDRSFVHDLPEREDSLAIVRAVTSLGESLHMTTTAEGVETADQLARLRAEGCTEVQGYLFSPAVPASETARLLLEMGHSAALQAGPSHGVRPLGSSDDGGEAACAGST